MPSESGAMASTPESFELLGCPCLAFPSQEDAEAHLEALVASGESHYSVAINAEKILAFRDDAEFQRLVRASHLASPDGSGAILALRWLHGASSIKLDLPRTALGLAHRRQWPVFLLGARDEVNSEATKRVEQLYPGISVVGRQDGYFKDDECVIRAIEASGAKVALVAMGSPKQERFASNAAEATKGVLFVGAGGALDILAGRISRAPKFMVDNHLEWFYRLIREPRRIRRQARLPRFALSLLMEWIRSGRVQ
jgi:N-acetylglucosaminyldiphosphoundecaprenol N-acetyl-beta-D-mannosaminyltransferase